MKYTIADQYLENLQKKATRIQKKCAALGLPFIFEIKEPTVIHWTNPNTKEKHMYPAHEVEVEGIAKINGWSFVAKIEHLEAGNLLQTAPDMECPESYRTAEPICEHCHTKHYRKETFVVRNENGEYKQVGRSCLKLYTSGMDAEACAEYASLAYMMAEMNGHVGEGFREVYCLAHIVASSYYAINKVGYDKDKVENIVYDMIRYNSEFLAKKGLICSARAYEDYKKQADEIICKAHDIQAVGDNYMGNVKVVFSDEFADPKHLRLIASYVYIYIKDMMKADKNAEDAKVSKHVGSVGDRIVIRIPVVNGMAYRVLYTKSYQVGWNRYSDVDVVEIRDADGNIYKWSASNLYDIQKAADDGATEILLKATVKKHDEYKGVKQTVVQRAKIIEVK